MFFTMSFYLFWTTELSNIHVFELLGENDKNIIFTVSCASGIDSTRHFIGRFGCRLRPYCDLTSLLHIAGTKINESHLAF